MTVCYFRRGDIRLVYFMVMMLLPTEALNVDHSCSARPDGRCERCDGTPQCIDLSDETGCSNSTINLVPISAAIEICRGKSCMKGFPEPPPLPPFSLCDDMKIPTTVSPSTKITESQTTKIEITTPVTKASIPPSKKTTLPPSVETTILPTKRTTATQTTTTTMPSTTTSSSSSYFPTWPWTTKGWTSRRWPVTPTTTATPPLSTIQWCSTTTTTTTTPSTEPHAPPFMEVWRFCAARHYFIQTILSCLVRILKCYHTPNNCRDTRPHVTTTPNHRTDWHQILFPVQTARPGFTPRLPYTVAPYGTRQPPRTVSPLVPTWLFHSSPVKASEHTGSKLPPETRHSVHPVRPHPRGRQPTVLDSNESNYLSNEQTAYDLTDMMYLQLLLDQINK